MKLCNNCQIVKSFDQFYTVNKRNKPQVYHICKACCATQKQESQGYYRDWELKKKYGISLETYSQECLARQNKCDICTKQVKSLHVDHCHTTGKIRGYLCGSCNRGLGLFQDSKDNLMKAYKYLNE